MIDKSTKVASQSKSLIDHFYTNCRDKIVKPGLSQITISDHFLDKGIFKVHVLKGILALIQFRDIRHFKEKNFLNDVKNLILLNFRANDDPNTMWIHWKTNFMEVVEKHAPLKKAKLAKSVYHG